MKSRAVPILVGALAMVLIVVAAGAASGGRPAEEKRVRIPNGSIGWKKLSPRVRKLVVANAGEQGAVGLPGAAGAPGSTGPAGTQGGGPSGTVLTYSAKLEAQAEIIPPPPAQPVVLEGEDGQFQEGIGPLTFFASCVSEGEDTIRAKLAVTASQSGVTFNGRALDHGVVKTVQELTVNGGDSEETFPNVVRATTADGLFAMQGVASLLVSLPGGCHFYGTLIEDS